MMKKRNRLIAFLLMMAMLISELTIPVSAATVKSSSFYTMKLSEMSLPINWNVTAGGSTISVDLYDKNAVDGDTCVIWVVQDYDYVSWGEFSNQRFSLSIDTTGLSTGTYTLYMSRYGVYQYGGVEFKIKDGSVFFYSKGGGSEASFRKKIKKKYKPNSYKKLPQYYKSSYYKNRSGISAITKKAKSICKKAKTKEKKIKAIHDWIAKNISYDYEQYFKGNIVKGNDPVWVYKHKRGVCGGYSRLAKIMYSAVGVPCIMVIGAGDGVGGKGFTAGKKFSKSKITHGWIYVYYKGGWRAMDVTWDSQNRYYGKYASKSRGYVNAKGQAPIYNYYGTTADVFGMTHYSWGVSDIDSK